MATAASHPNLREHALLLLLLLGAAWFMASMFANCSAPLELPALPDPAAWATLETGEGRIAHRHEPAARWLEEHRDDDALVVYLDGHSRERRLWRAVAAHTVASGGAVVMGDTDEDLYAAVPDRALDEWCRMGYVRGALHRDRLRAWLAAWDPAKGSGPATADAWTLVRFRIMPGTLTGRTSTLPAALAAVSTVVPLLMVGRTLLGSPVVRNRCGWLGSQYAGIMVHHAGCVAVMQLLDLAWSVHISVASGSAYTWDDTLVRIPMLYNALNAVFLAFMPAVALGSLGLWRRWLWRRANPWGRASATAGNLLRVTDPFGNNGFFDIGMVTSAVLLAFGLSPVMRL